ncbi:hypothetical protein ACC702_02435 [Rhizobium ruizarguesonis]|nr:hypothetical protein U8P68_28815 [Rhizobium ruizarguesonis]
MAITISFESIECKPAFRTLRMTSHCDQMRARLTAHFADNNETLEKYGSNSQRPNRLGSQIDYRHFSVRNPDDPWTGSVWGRGTDEIFASISLEGAHV